MTTPPPLVYVITDLGPTDEPGFLIQSVDYMGTPGGPQHEWAASATPFGDREHLTLIGDCTHSRLHVLLEEGMLICLDCTERFHPDQFPRAAAHPTDDDTPPPAPAGPVRKASDYLNDLGGCHHRWRNVHGGRACRRCGAVES
jgi:hypothetical protein